VGIICGDIELSENVITKFVFAVKTNKNNLPLEIRKRICREGLFETVKKAISEYKKLNMRIE
jgi:hypothetical protein